MTDIKDKPRSLSPTSFKAVVDQLNTAGAGSLAPEVKTAKERTARMGLAMAAFSDWFAMGALLYALKSGLVPDEYRIHVLGVIALIGAPSAVGSLLARLGVIKTPSGSATALLMAGAAKIGVGAMAKTTLFGMLMLLVGCGASIYDSTLATINTTADSVNQAQPAVLALCEVDPGPRCDDARKAYEVAGAAVAAAHDALEVYRVTGEGLDAVGYAVRKAAESAREVARVSAR